MRILQVNNFAPANQNKTTFKSKASSALKASSSIRELWTAASELYEKEWTSITAPLSKPATTATEAIRRDAHMKICGHVIPVGKFSEDLIGKFKLLMEQSKQVLLGKKLMDNPDEQNVVQAFQDARAFLHDNNILCQTDESLELYMLTFVDGIKVKNARPDLAPIFSIEA